MCIVQLMYNLPPCQGALAFGIFPNLIYLQMSLPSFSGMLFVYKQIAKVLKIVDIHKHKLLIINKIKNIKDFLGK